MKKQYLIVGDNNFWYATIPDTDNIQKEIENVRDGILNNYYNDGENPSELCAYEITGKYESFKLT